MRKVTLAALALSAAITTKAHADYLWQFVPTKVTAMDIDYSNGFGYTPDPTVSHKEAKSWLPTFDLTITDRAFRSRSLDLSWSGCWSPGAACQNGPTGDFSKVVSFSGVDQVSDPNHLYGAGLIDMAWNRNGKLTGDVELYGMLTDLTLSGSGNQWEGWYASDNSECGMQVGRCEITGHWAFLGDPPSAPLPEPASFALLAVGLLGAGAVRKLA